MYSDLSTIRTRRDGNILWVELHRPEHRNAIDRQLHSDLTLFLERAAAEEPANVIVLSGSGDAFSAGGDLRWFRDMTPTELDVLFDEARRLIYALLSMDQLVVTMVDGPAVGLGATVALISDFTVVSENAIFSDPHVQVGVVAGDGGAAIWPLLCGLGRAKRYLLLGDQIPADEAERLGLVDYVVRREHLQHRTQKLARRLADGPQKALRGTKRALNKHLEAAVGETLDLSLALEKECFSTEDHREAVAAFLEKRQPVFGAASERAI